MKRWIQIVLAALLVLSAVRLAVVLYQRKASQTAGSVAPAPPLDPDYYVVPRKLHDYDLKSLRRDLAGRTVWVREGYRFTYYDYDPQLHHVGREAGTLGPIERLQVDDVVPGASPEAGQRQIMAVFSKQGKSYAFPVGAIKGNDYQIFADEILFLDDPHQMYKHWPADVWEAISNHQMKAGMNEIQASFAIGMGVPKPGYDSSTRTVEYPNGGHPLVVTYRNGHAVQITSGN
jgi:hypothetical protein